MVDDVFLSIDVLKQINSLVGSALVNQDKFCIYFREKKLSIMMGDVTRTSAFALISNNEVETNIERDFFISMSLADSKTIASIGANEKKVRFIVKDGEYDVRIGPVKKKIHEYTERNWIEKFPAPPYKYKFVLNSRQIDILKRLMKTEDEVMRFMLTVTPVEVIISFENDDIKSTELSFFTEKPENEDMSDDYLLSKLECDAVGISAFPMKPVIAFFDCVPNGVDLIIDCYNDFPMQGTFETEIGPVKMVVAPIIVEE